ncbi:MAG: hypothetical protein JXB13_11450 [Phycisphaerae bacterium]|nr:hypothetical protein [Phycisphaerae bacterium]
MKSQKVDFRCCFIAAACLVLAGAGCSPKYTSSRTRVHTISQGNLDACRQVILSYDVSEECEGTQPEREYEQLTLEIGPRKHLHSEYTLTKIELKLGVPRGQLRFDAADARIDDSGQKVWFVERGTDRIIATLDLETGRTTGPDDAAPPWATPHGGSPLEPASD